MFGQLVLLFLGFLLHVREEARFYQPTTASIINHVLIGGEQEQGKKNSCFTEKGKKLLIDLKELPFFVHLKQL